MKNTKDMEILMERYDAIQGSKAETDAARSSHILSMTVGELSKLVENIPDLFSALEGVIQAASRQYSFQSPSDTDQYRADWEAEKHQVAKGG